MLKAVKTDTERRAAETRAIQEDMTGSIRKKLAGIKREIRILQLCEAIEESFLEAIHECHENARYIKNFKNGYITGHELVEALINIRTF